MRWKALLRSPSGLIGLVIVVFFLGVAAFAPLLAPKSPSAQDLRTALRPPGTESYILGSDELGK